MASQPLTADLVARAVIAAAKSFGDDPERALATTRGPLKRALTPAAAAVADATSRSVQPVATLLGLRGNNFSRSRAAAGYDLAYRAAFDAVKRELARATSSSASAAAPMVAAPAVARPAVALRVVTSLAAMKMILAELAKGPATGPDLMEALNLGEGQVRVALDHLSEEREIHHTAMTAEGWRAMFWRLPE